MWHPHIAPIPTHEHMSQGNGNEENICETRKGFKEEKEEEKKNTRKKSQEFMQYLNNYPGF